MNGDWQEILSQLMQAISIYGLDVLGGIIILIAGGITAGWVERILSRLLAKTDHMDATLAAFFSSTSRYVVLVFTILAMLSQFGVETTSFIAVIGTAGLAIGLALQGTLSNAAAGVMLLLFRPFKVGDYIDGGGVSGSVLSITLFVTEINTADNLRIIVPNAQLWGQSIINYSINDNRRAEIMLGIGYGDDIDQAKAIIMDVINTNARVLNDPAPIILVTGLGASSVDLSIRFWCVRGDFGTLKSDITQCLKQKLLAAGLSIPYPQQDIHIQKK